MKWILMTAAAVLATAPVVASSQTVSDMKKGHPVTLHGCVNTGGISDTFMTQISQVGTDSAVPDVAHGRRVIFWLDSEKELANYGGRMVEVRGRVDKVTESELELKAGKPKEGGGLMVEFEGPGTDPKVRNAAIGESIGTAGRTVAEQQDVKTFLIEVDVDSVRAIKDTCN